MIGGLTFCALASLSLLNQLHQLDTLQKKRLITWCVHRQEFSGFCGRINKQEDTCYAFWVGASLQVTKLMSVLMNRFSMFIL
jgi:geranylgeranyl transferase type-1 subunit beta